MKTQKIQQIQDQISKIKTQINALGPVRPGSLSKQYNICGTKGCRCKDPNRPKRHGPYYNLSYTRHGKGHTQFIRKEDVSTIKKELADYKRLKSLVDKWIDLSMRLAETRKALTS